MFLFSQCKRFSAEQTSVLLRVMHLVKRRPERFKDTTCKISNCEVTTSRLKMTEHKTEGAVGSQWTVLQLVSWEQTCLPYWPLTTVTRHINGTILEDEGPMGGDRSFKVSLFFTQLKCEVHWFTEIKKVTFHISGWIKSKTMIKRKEKLSWEQWQCVNPKH